MVKVAVVILNHNGIGYLKQFLPSVVQHSGNHNIIVADNGSTDGSVSFIQTHYPDVTVISLGSNEGFSKGYNLALQQIQAQYYVLLNSDVEVTPQWLTPLVQLMDSNENIGACQPKIKYYYQKNMFEYAGAAGGFIDKWGYPFCRGRIFTTVEEDTGQYDDTLEIFWASGACMMVRANAYWKTGGLDEYFFAHMEEIDLCWRMKNTGYSIFYCGESQVFHVGGGTLPKSNPRKTFLNFRNGLVLLYKNLPSQQLWPIIFVRLLLDGIAAIKFLVSDSVQDFMAVANAHFNFYRYFPLWSKRRKAGNAQIRINQHKQAYNKSIVYAYFVDKKKKFSEIGF
jgi:GT2 family glycosyltransferase